MTRSHLLPLPSAEDHAKKMVDLPKLDMVGMNLQSSRAVLCQNHKQTIPLSAAELLMPLSGLASVSAEPCTTYDGQLLAEDKSCFHLTNSIKPLLSLDIPDNSRII